MSILDTGTLGRLLENRAIRQIRQDFLRTSASGIISQALGIVAVFWVARLLGPSDFGVFNGVTLVLTYGAYMELGALSTMGRDLPYHYGRGDMENAAIVEGAARRTTIFGALLAAAFVIALSLVPTYSSQMAWGLRAMGPALVLQNVYTYHRTVLRSHNLFKELSQQQILLAAATLVLSVALVTFLGFEGRLFAAVLAPAAILVYALCRHPWTAVPRSNLPQVLSVIRVGLPILLSGFVLSLLATIDRLMVITFLGERQLGYFGLAGLLMSAVTLIPATASQVLYPRITHRYGSSGNSVEALRAFVLIPPIVLGASLPLLIGFLYLTLPLVIHVFMPEYVPAITAARIVVVGAFFYGILGLTDYFLVTIGKLKEYVLFGCLALCLNVATSYALMRLGYGIEGIAMGGKVITYLAYSSIVIGYALYHYTRRLGDWAKYFAALWFPFVYMFVGLWLVEAALNHLMPATSRMELLSSTVVKLLCCLLLYSPLAYVALRKLTTRQELFTPGQHFGSRPS